MTLHNIILLHNDRYYNDYYVIVLKQGQEKIDVKLCDTNPAIKQKKESNFLKLVDNSLKRMALP
jgi:hypothetical protein